MGRGLGTRLGRVDCLAPPDHYGIVDPVFDIGAGVGTAEQTLRVGFILGEQQRCLPGNVQETLAQRGMAGLDQAKSVTTAALF
jgi:hypothetical protein